MPEVHLVYGEKELVVQAPTGSLVGEVIAQAGLPLEQPCAGRGTCGQCKVLQDGGLYPPDDIERQHLTPAELAVGQRLACRARTSQEARIILAPVVVYSDKIFKTGSRHYLDPGTPLGLAIDLGSTTVAAFLTTLDDGQVCAGAASLNQQVVYGADVISRMAAALRSPQEAAPAAPGTAVTPTPAEQLHRLAVASIIQAVEALKLTPAARRRLERVVVVGNPVMHHLLARLPVESLARLPFEPFQRGPCYQAGEILDHIFPALVDVRLPPLVGGFVGSDALACLAFFNFDRSPGPMLAVDLGTNGEVMVTDGRRIVSTSTAAGPAFEGTNISCGSRAVDGAVTRISFSPGEGFRLETIAGAPPLGLTGSGLLSAVQVFHRLQAIDRSGRITPHSPWAGEQINGRGRSERYLQLSSQDQLRLTQWDIRELQKAKGAIRVAITSLLETLGLVPADLQQVFLTGSFGGQVDVGAALEIGLLPPINPSIIKSVSNGAGLGAAGFLTDAGFERAVQIASQAEHIRLEAQANFVQRFSDSLALA